MLSIEKKVKIAPEGAPKRPFEAPFSEARKKKTVFNGPVEKNNSFSHLVLRQEGVVDLGADVKERVAHPENALLEGHFVRGKRWWEEWDGRKGRRKKKK